MTRVSDRVVPFDGNYLGILWPRSLEPVGGKECQAAGSEERQLEGRERWPFRWKPTCHTLEAYK